VKIACEGALLEGFELLATHCVRGWVGAAGDLGEPGAE
jgi:hypothetical protein